MRWWLPLALAALSRSAEEPDFACFKQCGSRSFLCRWPPWGPDGNTTYVLTLCYAVPRLCQQHAAGALPERTLQHRQVYVLTNATAWVEARWGRRLQRSRNLTLYLDEAVKLDPPSAGSSFGKAGGRLRLRLRRPPCHRGKRPLQREARYRKAGDRAWTRVTCRTEGEEDGEDGEEESVSCSLGGSAAFELQLRHKPQHWSSYWSDWSETVFVPEEISASPELRYELGRLGGGGQRVLRLGWQRAREEQGDVTYALRVRMAPCRCAEPPDEDELLLGKEATGHNLTLCGAAYDVALTAANAAGPGPPRRLRVPAERRAGTAAAPSGNQQVRPGRGAAANVPSPVSPPELGFKGFSAAGGAVTLRWEAASAGLAYCFEKQPLAGAPQRDACVERDFPANSIHVERGELAEQACYRLAVHGWVPERDWATFALTYHYVGNASLAESIRINASADSAVLQWRPSPRAACPGVLKKYIICYGAEGHNLTYLQADASARHYTLGGLRPGTAYRLGIHEVTAEPGGACTARWHFQTKAPGLQPLAWKSILRYLGVLLGLPALAALCRLGKKRAARLLCPPLPKPRGSEAIRFSAADMGQGERRQAFVEPSEKFSRAELLVTEPGPEKEGAESRAPPAGAAEPPAEELPFEYRRQEVPGPAGAQENPGLCWPLLPPAPLGMDEPVALRGEGSLDAPAERSALL
ncbi:LOW QUALITY PROTEIN: interleukin-12 receptor subunit beta-1 [Apteryx mantelli]|uniref:LOW QUALITY PROTEIN: interleukin-12 receptor subunit beta-1 n=1 Tax=Apteryx mantelli TaxID=2696672 RepID=A0ABM4FW42_9AVES